MHIDKTIRTWRGIKLIEKKGILTNKAVILKEEKKNVNIIWYKFDKSSPGKIKLFIYDPTPEIWSKIKAK